MDDGLQRLQSIFGVVHKQVCDQVHRLLGRARAEHLAPGLLPNRWELELGVAWVHAVDLLLGRSPQHLDDLDQLVNTRITGEQWLSHQKLSYDAANGPDVNGRSIVSSSED